MSPPSSIACRTLDAETTPVAVRIRPARTRTALVWSDAVIGSATAALPGVGHDRAELHGGGHSEDDAHEGGGIPRRRDDQRDLREHAERGHEPHPHLAPSDDN